VLIFVFARVSCGLQQLILAEFAAVPNDQSPEISADVRATAEVPTPVSPASVKPGVEIGGPKGPEPTRFGDWERNGRCVDF
jgi:hypothetical protein